MTLGEEESDLGVFEHEGQALRRRGGVERQCVGRAGGLGLEEIVNRTVVRVGGWCRGRVEEQLLLLGSSKQRQGGQELGWVGGDAVEQGLEMAEQTGNRAGLEQVGAIVE